VEVEKMNSKKRTKRIVPLRLRRIKAKIILTGLTAKEISQKYQVSESMISKVLNGVAVSRPVMNAISRALAQGD
jgi:transcriptional regulator with XRE-family HTH domain